MGKLLILTGLALVVAAFFPVLKDEVWYQFMQLKGQRIVLSDKAQKTQSESPFGRLLSTRPIRIQPVNRDFSIVIEKIGVSVPIVADVLVTDEKAYMGALKDGIAHASTSQYPSARPGNVYLFAHASANFWQLGKYATVFNLLRKLELGDRIHVFYKGEDFVYEVVNKEVFKGWNTYPLTRAVIEPTLTLQTCDPPGTTLNRLVVTAKLLDVRAL
ncbi:sortase [candidate division WWE3 bacterium]|nr:sortase [candidate division WWE3 bacterium]